MVVSAESRAAQMAAAVAVAMHGRIGLKPCLAAEGLTGAQPSAGASSVVAVESRMGDNMHSEPRLHDIGRAELAGSVLEQATAIAAAVAVVNAGLPSSGRQPAGNSQSPCDKNPHLSALLYVDGS